MELVELETWSFRNLTDRTSLTWSPETNLVVGGNGQGKTNLLEAVAVLGNVRSFRTSRSRRLIRHGHSIVRIRGLVRHGRDEITLEQALEVGSPPRRVLSVNGSEVELGTYLTTFPVFVLAPGDRELVVGGPEVRRSFVDRIAFLLRPDHLTALRCYTRALRQRCAALVERASDAELEGWESQLSRHAARVVSNRVHAVATLDPVLATVYAAIGHAAQPPLTMAYRSEVEVAAEATMEFEYLRRYNDMRARDRAVGMTFDGPHRHDLALRADGRAVRDVLSAGQTKIVAAALRLASLGVVEGERETALPLVVDDIDAELDEEAVGRLVSWTAGRRQVFVSSVNESLTGLSSRRVSVIRMSDGLGRVVVR